MDTIARHARKLVKPYVRSKGTDAIIASAKRLARLVLSDSEILPEHKRLVLSRLQWFISNADGKYRTRFRSKLVVDLATEDPSSTVKINHEHVFTRREVTAKLISSPDSIDTLLDEVIGCIVTKEEHDRMPRNLSGWDRYFAAGIIVLDMLTIPPTAKTLKRS